MSLFGNTSNTGGGGGGGLFGSNTNATNQASGGGGLFGSNNTNQTNTGGGGLFGSSTNQTSNNTGGGGLFGSSTTQNANTGTTGGVFGSSTTQNKPATTGLFGSTTNQNQNQTQTGSTSLFGNTNNAQNTQGNASGGLFGTGANKPSTGLFGGSTTTPQNNTTGSLFGGSSILGTQNNQQAQNPQPALGTSVFNPPMVSVGNFGHTLPASQMQKLQFSGMSTVPNEKKVIDQIKTVYDKWNPNNPPNTPVTTVFKTYLYNAVPKEYAPFFYPNVQDGEDEQSWEEALSHKPPPPRVDGQEATNLAYVPIMCKGFKALGDRVETQAKIIQEMQHRLHEMNNSLQAVMDAHQQRITVKIQSTKRQHQVLSQRCLKLAVKVQVLRNRGYALDSVEENLRQKLIELEKQVMDPGFVGREDEIWARMVALRERARWLEEEGKRLSAQAEDASRQGANTSSGVPEEVLVKTRKILKDYDGQLQHLNRELEQVKKEYEEWEQSQQRRR